MKLAFPFGGGFHRCPITDPRQPLTDYVGCDQDQGQKWCDGDGGLVFLFQRGKGGEMESVLDQLGLHWLEDQPAPANEGDRPQEGLSDIESRGWNFTKDVLRARLVIMAGGNPDHYAREPWQSMNPVMRDRIRAAARDNPRVGPDMGLVPADGIYSNGVTVVDAARRKTEWKTWVR